MPVSCPECGATLGNRARIPGHYRREHPGKLPAELAGLSYRQTQRLLRAEAEKKRLPAPRRETATARVQFVREVPSSAREIVQRERVRALLPGGEPIPEGYAGEDGPWDRLDRGQQQFWISHFAQRAAFAGAISTELESDGDAIARRPEPGIFYRVLDAATSPTGLAIIAGITWAAWQLSHSNGAGPERVEQPGPNPWESTYTGGI